MQEIYLKYEFDLARDLDHLILAVQEFVNELRQMERWGWRLEEIYNGQISLRHDDRDAPRTRPKLELVPEIRCEHGATSFSRCPPCQRETEEP